MSDLNVNGSLQISILAGLIDLKGSASYLHKKKSTCRESSVHVRFKYLTAVKSLTMDQLDESKIRYPEIAKNGKIGKATHVVTQIQYGAEATFTFTKQFENDDEEQKASGELKLNVEKFLKQLNEKTVEVKGNYQKEENDNATSIKCQFEGDFKLPDDVKGPTTFEEALEFSKNLIKVSSNSMAKDTADEKPLGVPCTVWLYPLALMQDAESAPAIRHEISLPIASECIRLIEEYDNLEDKLDAMLNDPVIKQISPLYRKLRLFHQYLTSFRAELKMKLGKLVTNIRSGEVEIDTFRHLLNHMNCKHFPFNPNCLSDRWLVQKYREFCMMKRFTEEARQKISQQNRVHFFPCEKTMQEIMTNYPVDFGIELSFPWLGRAEPFLDIVRTHALNSDNMNGDPQTTDNAIDNVWYENYLLVERIQKEINVFATLVNDKFSDSKFAFVLTTPDDENATYASESSIIVHHKQRKFFGWNALRHICQHYPPDNLTDVVLLLLNDTQIDKYWHKFNSLFILCRFYQKTNLFDFVQIFLDRNIEVSCKNDEGWTPLLSLCRYYDNENLIGIIRLFLNKNIDFEEVNRRNNEGWNALHILCRYYVKDNLINIVKLLLDRKIDINCRNNKGWNALHFVCRFQPKINLPGLVSLLVQNEIEKEVETAGSETASSFLLERFIAEDIKEVIQILDLNM